MSQPRDAGTGLAKRENGMFWTELRFSARSLWRNRGLAAMLLLTIALGIGSNAALAGFVRGLVTRDVPIERVDRIASIFARDAQDAFGPVSYDEYVSVRAYADAFATMGVARERPAAAVVNGRASVRLVAAITSDLANLFQLPLQDGVVISHRLWQDEFGGRTDIRGERVRIDDTPYRIGGVAPEWLDAIYAGSSVDLWAPWSPPSDAAERRGQTLWALGRLHDGVSASHAQALVNTGRETGHLIAVLPYTGLAPEGSAGMSRMRAILPVVTLAVFFIACVNVATFLLARSSARSRESSVRMALGASRGQIARQLLADSVVISITGTLLGILLALWTSRIVPALLFDRDAEQLVFRPDLFGTVAASLACATTMIVCGLAPLIEARHDDPARVLRRESAGPSATMQRFRDGLVIAQMTCCCVLIISTAILVSGFRSTFQTSAGRRLKHAILATVQSRYDFSRPDLGLQYFRDVEQSALSMSQTVETAWSGTPPGSRSGWQLVRIEPPNLPMRDVTMDVALFTPPALALITLPPLAGRMFGAVDSADSCRVVVVNQAARDLLGSNPVGSVIQDPFGQRVEIIGVVAARPTGTPVRPTVYYYPDQNAISVTQIGPGRFRAAPPASSQAVVEATVVSPTYFDVMGLAVTSGRTLTTHDTPGCRQALANQDASERYFGGNAVGGAVIDASGRRTEIVGVVHPVVLRASERRAQPAVYLPMTQDFLPRMTLIVATRQANPATIAEIRARIDAVPGGKAPAVVTTLEQHLSRVAMAPERIAIVLVGASAAVALALGVLGLYGAMADAVHQRRREFGVRVALGSQGWRLVRQVVTEGGRLAAAGTVAGLLLSRVVARWIAQVSPSAGVPAVWVWLAAPLALLGAVLIASVFPARVALGTNPLSVMRDE